MPSHTVIRTKLFPPVSRSQLVNRSRLLDLQTKDKKLTLVCAPAGFGKTTIMGQLYGQLQKSGVRCCWYSMDYEDRDPLHFLRHVIAALNTSIEGFGSDLLRLLNTTIVTDITDTIGVVINELADISCDLTLFIDDFHHGNAEQITQFIELLVNLSPPGFRLVIASRIRPALPLSNLRVHNELNEISVNQLRFDATETREFLHRILKSDLTPRQLADLVGHSEGWAAGLQLASLSLRDPSRRDKFISSFSGSLRDIADYLTTDVLNQQPPEVRDFLLRTSVLDRLNAGVCDALTKSNHGQELLELVESNNLFLVPLDENCGWYRYHHLFQEFLFTQLRRIYPSEIVSLYTRASDWFAQAGYINEAVNYALSTGDMNKFGRLVHTGTMELMTMQGRMVELLSWVNRIPPDIKMKFPRLLIQECLALAHLCRPVEAAHVATQVRTSIRQLDTITDYHYSEVELKQIHTEEAVLPLMIAFAEDDTEHIEIDTLQAIETSDDLILAMIHNFLGYVHLQKRQLAKAHEHLNKGRFHHLKQKIYYGAIFSDCFIAMSHVLQYQLHVAYEHVKATERLAREIPGGHAPGMAKTKIMQATVLYEWNEIDKAMELLDTNLPLIENAGQVSIPQLGYLTLARCHAAKKQFDTGLKALNRCLHVSQHTNRDYINLVVESEKLRFANFSGDINQLAKIYTARQIVDLTQKLQKRWDRVTFFQLLVLLQSSFYAEEYDVVENTVTPVKMLCDNLDLKFYSIKLQLLAVLSNMKLGKTASAYSLLAGVIELVYPQGGIRIILDAGPEIRSVLGGLSKKLSGESGSVNQEFTDRLFHLSLAETAGNSPAGKQSAFLQEKSHALIEPLNKREIEIIKLLAMGETNAGISATLFISENTVKWHIKNIFAKLGVNNRAAAVATALQFQLINN